MSVTPLSRRESRVTGPSCHMGCHKTPTRPDPTRPLTTTGLGFSSMTPGGLGKGPAADRSALARLMDGGFAEIRGPR